MASKVSGVIEKIQTGGSSGTAYAIASTAYGYCETDAGTAAKTVDMTDFKLYEGVTIHVKFKNSNSASNPTLNVQGTGAKPIIYGITTKDSIDNIYGWNANDILTLTYDGTNWVSNNSAYATSAGSAASCTGNAATATTLAASKTIWGQSFDGSENITGHFTMGNTSSRYHYFYIKQHGTNNTVADIMYDSGNATNVTSGRWRFSEYSPNSTANNNTTGYTEIYYLPTVTKGLTETATYNILTTKDLSFSITGNANTATSAGKWTTARTLTIGNTGKSVDGSKNVSWSLAEIGAAPAVDGGYLPLSGGTMTGRVSICNQTSSVSTSPNTANIELREVDRGGDTVEHIAQNAPRLGFHWDSRYWGQLALFNSAYRFYNSTMASYFPVYMGKNTIDHDTAASSTTQSGQLVVKSTGSNAVAIELYRNTSASWQIINTSGELQFNDNYTTSAQATYVNNCFKMSYNTGNATFKGTVTAGGFSGSLTGHASLDLPLTGGTLTGAVNFANNTWNKVGDDVQIGDINKAGHLGIQGVNGNTGIFFTTYNQTTKTVGASLSWNGTDLIADKSVQVPDITVFHAANQNVTLQYNSTDDSLDFIFA